MNFEYLREQLNHAVDRIAIQLSHLHVLTRNTIQRVPVVSNEHWARAPLEFSPLQFTLLKVLLALLLGTAGLIWYSWRSFGKVITEKFVRPSTLKEIEELKLSVAKLKLPKEHSPRI